jgi:hypothetical protein
LEVPRLHFQIGHSSIYQQIKISRPLSQGAISYDLCSLEVKPLSRLPSFLPSPTLVLFFLPLSCIASQHQLPAIISGFSSLTPRLASTAQALNTLHQTDLSRLAGCLSGIFHPSPKFLSLFYLSIYLWLYSPFCSTLDAFAVS